MSQRHLAPRGALGLSSPMAADAEDTRKPAGAGQLTPHAVKLASMGDSSLRISSFVFLLRGGGAVWTGSSSYDLWENSPARPSN